MSGKVMGPGQVKGPGNGAKKCHEFGHRNKRGEPCGANVIAGTTGCWRHAGKSMARAKAEGAVVLELRRWGLDGHTELRDAGEVLLKLVTQSAARVEMYSRLLAEAFEAAEQLRQAHAAAGLLLADPEAEVAPGRDGEPEEIGEHPALAAARLAVDRVFATGGVAALVGYRFDADRWGRVFAVDEGIRGLARLEAEERDRCAGFAAKAVAAGLAERQVRLAERQGQQMWAVFARVLDALGLSEEQRARVPGVLEAEVRALVGSVSTIEGSVA
jgi:hypothetical protein